VNNMENQSPDSETPIEAKPEEWNSHTVL
jgi:hypothetical protein